MKYVLIILALIGITASALALREKYRPYGESPCDINDRWDCGIVNHSRYAVFPSGSEHGIPVAVIGIAGYLVLGVLALFRRYFVILVLAIPALAFALYLAHIEERVLGVWCLYCAISLGTISLITLLVIITVLANGLRKRMRPV
ncbi:MAG TPA: vitamin K epoxide reductase family protein [Terriglobales bacterium]|jgi:vitamin-K-epoxide reductase (warfarin-sensitive)|nr:vitamin K epoxide reductase family protein [Terriglobales bacterium]